MFYLFLYLFFFLTIPVNWSHDLTLTSLLVHKCTLNDSCVGVAKKGLNAERRDVVAAVSASASECPVVAVMKPS